MRQYLITEVNGNNFAIDIFEIEQIIEYKKPAKIAGTSSTIAGVVNVYDKFWSIIDLKKLLLGDSTSKTQEVENNESSDNLRKMILLVDGKHGLLVDRASTIESVEEENINDIAMDNEVYKILKVNNIIASVISMNEIMEKLQSCA